MAEPTSFTPGPVGAVTAQAPFSADFHVAPQFDALELLPPNAAERLRKLRVRRDDAYAVTISHGELQSLTVERLQAEQRLQRLQAHAQDHGFNLPDTDSRVIAQQKLVDKLTADLERLNARAEKRAAAFQAASGALANAESWLKDGGRPGGTALADFDGPQPILNKGETVIDAIERLRRRGRELKADAHRIASAPYPSKHAKARMREAIEALAQRGTPDVSGLIEHDDQDVAWATTRQQSEVIGAAQRALAFHEAVDVVGLLAFLLKPAMISALDALIDAEKDDAASLSPEARGLAASEVQNDLLATERDLAAFVFQAQAQGLQIEHGDISPLALLDLKLITVARAAPSPLRASYSPAGGRR
jgi:hypothetical protein